MGLLWTGATGLRSMGRRYEVRSLEIELTGGPPRRLPRLSAPLESGVSGLWAFAFPGKTVSWEPVESLERRHEKLDM
jgi:hypothetical protein